MLAAVAMPALLPKGALLHEEGAYFIDGLVHKFMLEISPDGFIEGSNGNSRNFLNLLEGNIAIEIKSPFPDENMLPVHYEIPVYYSLQLLCVMKVKKCNKIWYISCSLDSFVIIELDFDETIWKEVWRLICELYNHIEIPIAKKKAAYRDEVRQTLKQYIEKNSKLVAEFPCLKADISIHGDVQVSNAYKLPVSISKGSSCRKQQCSKLRDITHTYRQLIDEAYNLQHCKATEVLAFIMSDIDRIHHGEKPNQILIVYTLKGFSLSTDVLRCMIDDVHNVCHKEGIKVIADCLDVQWAWLPIRSKEGAPLTYLQFQKDCWARFCKWNKQALIKKLLDYCTIDEITLVELQHLMFLRKQNFKLDNLEIQFLNRGSSKVLAIQTVEGMMKNITSTHVKSAWIRKKAMKKIPTDSNDVQEDVDANVIDILSLIPPESLAPRNQDQDHDGSHIEEVGCNPELNINVLDEETVALPDLNVSDANASYNNSRRKSKYCTTTRTSGLQYPSGNC